MRYPRLCARIRQYFYHDLHTVSSLELRFFSVITMADGLSVAANLAGLVSLGIEVTNGLLDYFETYRSRESDLAQTTKKLHALLIALNSLRKQFAERKFRDDEQELLKQAE